MFAYRYYVYHKVQVGKKGEIIEAGRMVKHSQKISSIKHVQQICAALAQSHGVQENHIMICTWKYLGFETNIVETVKGWIMTVVEDINRAPQAAKS